MIGNVSNEALNSSLRVAQLGTSGTLMGIAIAVIVTVIVVSSALLVFRAGRRIVYGLLVIGPLAGIWALASWVGQSFVEGRPTPFYTILKGALVLVLALGIGGWVEAMYHKHVAPKVRDKEVTR